MDVEGYADKLIREATERGEMNPEGSGKPLGKLENDPDWWVRAFLEREMLPERYAELRDSVEKRIDLAIHAETLDEARAILATTNRDVSRWNREAPESFRLEETSEIELVTRRAQRPAG